MLIGGKVELGHKVESVRLDANGYVYVIGSSGSPVYCRAGDDAAGGGPYYLRTDADGALLVGTDGVDGTLLRTDANGRLQLANYVAITNSNRVAETDPLCEHYNNDPIAEVIDGADATHMYYADMSTYRTSGWSVWADCAAGTVTITMQATDRDDGTAPGAIPAADWHEVTTIFGVASLISAAAAVKDWWVDDAGILGNAKYVRFTVVAATGAASGDWTIIQKRLY